MAATAFMVGMQIAGSIVSIFGASQQQKMIALGRQVSNAQLQTNLSAIQAKSSEAALEEMKQLRQNIGSQIAIQAARGTASGAGSARSLQQDAFSKFGQDELTRRMNLLSNEASLRAGNALSGLHTLQSESQLGRSVTSTLFNTLSTNDFSGLLFGTKKKAGA